MISEWAGSEFKLWQGTIRLLAPLELVSCGFSYGGVREGEATTFSSGNCDMYAYLKREDASHLMSRQFAI
jgi:hypothetical protein